MDNDDTLCYAADKLKGICVILSCMSVDSSTGTTYTDMPDALKFLADQIYDIATEIENVRTGKVSEE